ncbi:1-deoxy-D-xylulose-5-phosphate synthase [Corynebacterium caspium]|uniref:1-deoxy-D-xylulose-5-phosphate synthase n=1 Tax=Corynebacterium caspium TaxID=234828 RepID=UPI0003778B3B|nr:1-deoxy-D-xylulose-5-phosphate synthase [Corynebacterium caspium]WKD59158.1 1-deoxy-D-xylulose-5-phosphate synthase [Corynebacterium caspium DSM 44850]
MGILKRIHSPEDLRRLSLSQRIELCKEIRDFLVEKVSITGGHLGPNLGVVELTVGLHSVFKSPHDPIIFDTSHQSYVHKILTGRAAGFDNLRKRGGLSGYTDRSESEHDWTESSHASASLSYAEGLSRAFKITGQQDRTVVAVIGDGAMTGGMSWEALNNIAADKDRNIVIVVNDNGRSYEPTIGGFAESLANLRMTGSYDKVMEHGKSTLKALGWVGERTFDALHAFKEGVKSTLLPTEMFPELGMKYIGPVDGHDLGAVTNALEYARDYQGPIIVHMVTEKGRGFAPAATESADLMHSTGAIDPVTGKSTVTECGPSWTSYFSHALIAAAKEREDIVAITAAMAGPTGLAPFAKAYPKRFIDVGIAEAHALTSAAGLALGGLHPVIAIYSTFLNRAFDQLLMDAALLQLPITLVLDRAGVTGNDGPSHNGVWDMAITSIVPGMKVAAPRDGIQLKRLFNEALDIKSPTAIRFPKGEVPAEIPALEVRGTGTTAVEVLSKNSNADNSEAFQILVISIGALAAEILEATAQLATAEFGVTVLDPCWVSPISPIILEEAANADLVVTVEDGIIRGGIGSNIGEAMASAGIDTPIRHLATPDIFLEQASRAEVLADSGISGAQIGSAIKEWAAEVAKTTEIAEVSDF